MTDIESESPFCSVPFGSLIVNPDGLVGCCREKGSEHVIGDMRHETLDQIWNGPKLRAWRAEFLSGNIKTCSKEMSERNCHKLKLNLALEPFITKAEVQDYPPVRFSPDFNGQCNLKCPMCHVWLKPNGLYDKIDFWEDAETYLFPHLKIMDPLAGEPFIQKDFYRLIDIMIRVNPECVWTFTTNAHWTFTPFIKERLDQLKIFSISVSLDSVDKDNYKRIRTGDLSKVLGTIEKLIEYNRERKEQGRSFRFIINATIHAQNWWELKSIIEFTQRDEIFPFIQFLVEPPHLSLSSLSLKKRLKILQSYLLEFEIEQLVVGHRVIRSLIESLPDMYQTKFFAFYSSLTNRLLKEVKSNESSINLNQVNFAL